LSEPFLLNIIFTL